MVSLILRRVLVSVAVLWLVTILVFAGTEILPGDVADAVLGQNATEESLAAVRQRLGLDRPALVRYVEWLRNAASGSLGVSLASGRPVSEMMEERIGNTLRLATLAALIAVPIALTIGVVGALRAGRLLDRSLSTMTLCFMSVPEYFVAALLVLIFAVRLRWLPVTATPHAGETWLQNLAGLVLPVITLTVVLLAHMARMTRAAILNVMSSPYVENAILKGMTRARVVVRHALPNALPPILNVVALNLAYLVSGVIVVETVFNYPGLGSLMVSAVATHDLPVVQACALDFCMAYVILNLAADVMSILANPRLRYPK
jgi:peptide/nickel transport system permease protein